MNHQVQANPQVPVKTAVILAAGMGSRLADLWPGAPKGLLPFGNTPLVERSIRQLLRHSIEEIILVTGHQAGQYEALAARYPAVKTVHNPLYATSGSMYSLYCARHLLPGGFLLLESDLIYEDRALGELLAAPRRDAILISGPTGAGDEVYVGEDHGRVTGLSKQKGTLHQVAGEMVGISQLSAPFFQAMLAYAEGYFQQTLKLEYCTGCINGVARQEEIFYCKIDDLVWTEIDDHNQWERAQSSIFPRLLAQGAE